MRKLVRGFGINDADYAVCPRVNGRKVWCPFYVAWMHMLERQEAKWWERYPTYTGCKVCDEWRSFMAFRAWMMTQDWQGKELDKDLCGDGKLYSPETCVFVTQAINKFVTDSGAARGALPIGVSTNRNGFRSQCNGATPKYQGTFKTPHEAHQRWRSVKRELGLQLIEQQTCPRTAYGIWNYLLKI